MTPPRGKHLSFPFHVGSDGLTATIASLESHIRDEVIQLILTNPGERVNLPEFGSAVRLLVFENTDQSTAGMTKARITQAIIRWLGHRVSIEDLKVTVKAEKLEVELKYRIAGTEDTRVMRFQRQSE